MKEKQVKRWSFIAASKEEIKNKSGKESTMTSSSEEEKFEQAEFEQSDNMSEAEPTLSDVLSRSGP